MVVLRLRKYMKPSTLRKVPSLNYWMPLVEDEEQVQKVDSSNSKKLPKNQNVADTLDFAPTQIQCVVDYVHWREEGCIGFYIPND